MHRKGFKADPLRNEGDMKVFYLIAGGMKTPTEIAKALKIRPPTVLEHLEKLMKIGFLERGEKKGRSQLYEVNWKRVIDKFWTLSGIHEYLIPPWTIKEVEEKTKAVLKELKGSSMIRALIKDYFKSLPEFLLESGPSGTLLFFEVPTFYDAAAGLEGEVARYKYDEKEIENKELHRLLRKWQDYLTRVHTLVSSGASHAILNAIKFKEEFAEEF